MNSNEPFPDFWPLGHGVVMTGLAVAKGHGLLMLRAVRDELVGQPGKPAGYDAWEACEGAPTLTLAFADLEAIERLSRDLADLADAMKAAA